MTDTNPFQIGQRVRMAILPEAIGRELAVTVNALGVCDDEGCTKPTVVFDDPETGEEDEAHAEDFELVEAEG